MRRTWGAVRRPRTVAVLLLAAALSLAAAPAGARPPQHAQQGDRSVQARHAVASDLSIGVPSVLPSPASAVPASRRAEAAPARAGVADPAGAEPGRGRVVFLTFDDGPDPRWTPQVLAVLARYHATATFFEVGSEVRDHPDVAAAVRAAGQSVGNHTAHHAHLTALPGAALLAEVRGGPQPSTCLRPPYGEVDARVRLVAARFGLKVVLWDVETDDWAKPGVDSIVRHLLHDVRPGSTVIMHDGGGDRSETVAALRTALPVLAARGYRFAAVPGC